MNVPATIRPKIAKLLPLLGSSHPGEIVAAAEAIGRTLKAAECDWHELAATIETATAPAAISYRSWNVPQPKPFDPDAPPRWNELCRSERNAWLDLITTAAWTTDWEKSLAASLREQDYRRPDKMLSPRQKGVLTILIAKAMARGERP